MSLISGGRDPGDAMRHWHRRLDMLVDRDGDKNNAGEVVLKTNTGNVQMDSKIYLTSTIVFMTCDLEKLVIVKTCRFT